MVDRELRCSASAELEPRRSPIDGSQILQVSCIAKTSTKIYTHIQYKHYQALMDIHPYKSSTIPMDLDPILFMPYLAPTPTLHCFFSFLLGKQSQATLQQKGSKHANLTEGWSITGPPKYWLMLVGSPCQCGFKLSKFPPNSHHMSLLCHHFPRLKLDVFLSIACGTPKYRPASKLLIINVLNPGLKVFGSLSCYTPLASEELSDLSRFPQSLAMCMSISGSQKPEIRKHQKKQQKTSGKKKHIDTNGSKCWSNNLVQLLQVAGGGFRSSVRSKASAIGWNQFVRAKKCRKYGTWLDAQRNTSRLKNLGRGKLKCKWWLEIHRNTTLVKIPPRIAKQWANAASAGVATTAWVTEYLRECFRKVALQFNPKLILQYNHLRYKIFIRTVSIYIYCMMGCKTWWTNNSIHPFDMSCPIVRFPHKIGLLRKQRGLRMFQFLSIHVSSQMPVPSQAAPSPAALLSRSPDHLD